MWHLNLSVHELIIRIVAAGFFGAVIGLERQLRGKPAGLRTMMLVGLGAAFFVLAGEEISASNANGARADVQGRVVAAVIGGIGFLGAGTILRDVRHVSGMTTAAAIWVTAGIGVVCGLGEFLMATLFGITTILTLFFLGLAEYYIPALHPREDLRRRKDDQ